MAGQTIGKVVAGGKTHTVTSTFYGTCATAATTAAKEVIINETNTTEALSFIPGMTLAVKFVYSNTAANPTITCYNNSGSSTAPTKGSTTLLAAKSIYQLNTNLNAAGTVASNNEAGSWKAGAVVVFVYDGVGWVETSSTYNLDTDTFRYPAVYVATVANQAAKGGSLTSSSWSGLTGNRYLFVDIYFDNSAASALTLDINSQGPKPIFINGVASSESNHTLPRGTYIVYYVDSGTDPAPGFYFRTDGKIPKLKTSGSITTTATTISTSHVSNGVLDLTGLLKSFAINDV